MIKPTLVIETGWSAASLRKWNRIATENEDSEGSYFHVVGFPASAFDRPTDAIPHQSAFEARVGSFLTAIGLATCSDIRVPAIEALFEFLLRPAYGPFHRKYSWWRRIVHDKCVEFCTDARGTKRLRFLCRRFVLLYPL
jgi:hypothetical protein